MSFDRSVLPKAIAAASDEEAGSPASELLKRVQDALKVCAPSSYSTASAQGHKQAGLQVHDTIRAYNIAGLVAEYVKGSRQWM